MSITIDNDLMVTAGGMASAVRKPETGTWHVVWFPTLDLDRNQAVSALMITDHIMTRGAERSGYIHLCDGKCKMWPFIVTWASEIYLAGEEACTMIENYATDKGMKR